MHNFHLRLLTIFLSLTLATPLLFATLTPNYFATPQTIYLFTIALLSLLSFLLPVAFSHQLPYSTSPIRLPLILCATALSVILLINPEARLESYLGLGLLFYILLFLAYVSSLLDLGSTRFLSTIFFITTAILSLHSVLQLTFLHTLPSLPAVFQSQTFTPTGSILTTIIILLISALAAALTLRHTTYAGKVVRILALTLNLIAIVGYLAIVINNPTLIPSFISPEHSWGLTLDSLKAPKQVLVGVGLANFPSHFMLNRPLALNATSYWTNLPSTVISELLQLIITSGILFPISLIYLVLTAYHSSRSHSKGSPFPLIMLLSSLALTCSPGSVPLYTLFFLSIGLSATHPPSTLTLKPSSSMLITLTTLLFAATISIPIFTYARAEYSLSKATDALKKNDSSQVYSYTLRAANLLPSMTNYRLSSSQVYLSLGASLSQKQNVTAEDKQTISQLVAQSIREAKIATSLRPTDSRTWVNLGNVYANLLGVASGADEFALTAYAQAITLDPGSAPLRNELGRLLLTLAKKTNDDAARLRYASRASTELQTSLQLRSDYIQTLYLLSQARLLLNDSENAKKILESIITKVPTDSPDHKNISELLTQIANTKSSTPSSQNQ